MFIFLSTPTSHFYPRSPCGERPFSSRWVRPGYFISIHALLAESDFFANVKNVWDHVFLSTLSLRRATGLPARRQISEVISIHALLAESDVYVLYEATSIMKFLSTLSLRRATIFALLTVPGLRLFLSTLSLRRATPAAASSQPSRPFLSTLSLRRATRTVIMEGIKAIFLSTLSLRRATILT